jgi:hypothetical protein
VGVVHGADLGADSPGPGGLGRSGVCLPGQNGLVGVETMSEKTFEGWMVFPSNNNSQPAVSFFTTVERYAIKEAFELCRVSQLGFGRFKPCRVRVTVLEDDHD